MKKYLWACRWLNLLNVILIIVLALILVCTALIHTFEMNALINREIVVFFQWYGVGLLLWGTFLTMTHFSTILQEKTIQKMITLCREDIVKSMEATNYESFHEKQAGGYVSWLNNDMLLIEENGFKGLYKLCHAGSLTVFSLISLLAFDYRMVMLTLFLTLIIVYLPNIYKGKMEKATINLSAANELFNEKVSETILGFDVFSFANLGHLFKNRMKQSSEKLNQEKVRFMRKHSYVNSMISGISILSQMLILALTAVLAFIGEVSVGAMISTGSLAGNVFSALSEVSSLKIGISSINGIFEKYKQFADKTEEEAITSKIEELNQKLVVTNLSYAVGKTKILDSFSMEIAPQKKYIVVGESGSGKSTLLKILSGAITSYQGEISYGERNYSELKSTQIKELVYYVSQEDFIFKDTLKANIILGRNISEERYQSVLADLMLTHLDNPELILGNDNSVSAGQAQRIHLARGLVSDNPILLLDESTSNLDKETALKVEESLTQSNKSIVFVTHHMTDILEQTFDQVIKIPTR